MNSVLAGESVARSLFKTDSISVLYGYGFLGLKSLFKSIRILNRFWLRPS
ncbi:hypothetical protein SynROS8604_02109 [Synechococcus sp. ROS8604]|nr:hypothetical protein SynROS8604_02109 [Synechococcus sp. ROS8604]